MRRKYFGWAIAAIATLGPMQAWGGDREIAEQIISRLKSNRDTGALKDFTLDMKVDDGVVMFRGNVAQAAQKDIVLKSAAGIEGISKVVDEVTVAGKKTVEATPADSSDFSMSKALASTGSMLETDSQGVVPGQVMPTAAIEPALAAPILSPAPNDQHLTDSIVGALGAAQKRGELRGFGIDIQSKNGVVELVGQAASPTQRDRIVRIAEGTPGVSVVRHNISASSNPVLPAPQQGQVQAMPASHVASQQQFAGQTQATPAAMQMHSGAPVMGQPVPMAPYQGGNAAPRYDSPYLPNYAWPGYAAYPNYAAVTYPQQYSPSAFPFIGPFYPYPQVPLGWRKVSLEWDDGWWQLDFTDR